MTTLQTIVREAFAVSGITAVGTEPEADEFSEGLRRLQVLIPSLFGNELGEKLIDYSFGQSGSDNNQTGRDYKQYISSAHIPANGRIVFNINQPYTIYLDSSPNDGQRFAILDNQNNFATYPLTIDGNGRRIGSSTSLVINTNGASSEWFYRADLGEWVQITSLTAFSESPFPAEFDDFLTLMLAMRINPRFNIATDPATQSFFSRIEKIFKSRYRQKVQIGAELSLSLPWRYHAIFPSTSDFNRGFF